MAEEVKPQQKTDWREGKHPLSVRIKTPEKVKFMEALITEKGNSQAALDHCVEQAMLRSAKGDIKDDWAKLAVDRALKIQTLEQQIKELEQRPTNNGLPLDEAITKALAALKAKKKLSNDIETVRYALTYVLKNDWL